MHRLSTRTLTVVSLVGLLAAASLPAYAKSSRPKQHRGKKALGEVVSFDAATSTLVVDLPGDEDFTGAVAPDVQVKLDHRGWNKRGDTSGNPTEGSVEDLLPGTPVLRMKVEDDLVTKIRVRPLAEEAPPAEEEDDTTETGDDPAVEDPDVEDPADDETVTEPDNDPDDPLDTGDTEDTLPPLPVPQP